MSRKIRVTPGSGNVFADLGFDNPEEMLAKAELARRIGALLRARRLTQSAAARLLGVGQPDVSRLLRGQLNGFSYERLLKFLNALGCDVEIVIRHSARARRHAQVMVRAA